MLSQLFSKARIALIIALAMLPMLGAVGCEREPEDKIGDGIEDIGDGIKDAGDDAGDKAKDAVDDAGDAVEDAVD